MSSPLSRITPMSRMVGNSGTTVPQTSTVLSTEVVQHCTRNVESVGKSDIYQKCALQRENMLMWYNSHAMRRNPEWTDSALLQRSIDLRIVIYATLTLAAIPSVNCIHDSDVMLCALARMSSGECRAAHREEQQQGDPVRNVRQRSCQPLTLKRYRLL